MSKFERKITDEMREAIFDAGIARKLTHKRIAELAASGELVPGKPFEITWRYAGTLIRKEQRRRAGKTDSALALMPAQDAREALRRAAVSFADSERMVLERIKPADRDPARLQQFAKLCTEVARIPGPKDTRPANPTSRDAEGKTRGKLTGTGGALMAEHLATRREPTYTGPSDREGEHEGARSDEGLASEAGSLSLARAGV